jgi:succinate dehydrogenase flavin-adding protein (antitoxin of CptAB toxin-antitoxin module)
MESDFDSVVMEAALADKMVLAIYQRFKSDIDARHLQPKPFKIEAQREALKLLKAKLLQFCRQPKMFMTEQSQLIEHFFSAFVSEVEAIHQEVYEIVLQWPDKALMPLMQYAKAQKLNLENQLSELKRMANSSREMKQQQSELKRIIEQSEQQLKLAEQFKANLHLPQHQAMVN